MSVVESSSSGKEVLFGEDEIIVSKTDEQGIITYANKVFQRVAGYTEQELLGQPHNIIRHSGMPKAVFKLLWDTIKADREIFAYVVNRAKNGDYYWVFAHVTPSYDVRGRRIGYHSNRRCPHRDAIPKVHGLYQQMLEIERQHSRSVDAMKASTDFLVSALGEAGQSYDEFVFGLSEKTSMDSAIV